MTSRRFLTALSVVVLYFSVAFSVYGGSLSNQFVSWDDHGLIVENPHARQLSLSNLRYVFTHFDPELYIPLTFVSYQLNAELCGVTPACFHTVDLVLHTLSAALVAYLLFELLGTGWIAVLLGLLFLVHPLNTEAVSWASARKDTLSTFFFLSAFAAYIRYVLSASRRWYHASILLFLLAALSKVTVITLPILLVMTDLLQGRTDRRKMLAEKLPHFLIAIVFGVVAFFGKSKILVQSTALQKVLMACKSTVFYLVKFLLPSGLSVMVPYTKTISFLSPDFFVPVLVVLALIGVIGVAFRRHRMLAFGLSFFLITLVPSFFNFAKAGDLYVASDRYAYIPMIGLLFVVGVAAVRFVHLPSSLEEVRRRVRGVQAVFIALLMIFAHAAAVQAHTWSNSTALYEQTLRNYPNAHAAHNNLGMELLESGRYDEAIASFDRALAIKRDPMTFVNRAVALAAKGDIAAAEAQYRAVIALAPDLPDAEYGLGNLERSRGNLTEAAQHYRAALQIDPSYTNALNNLGATYIELKDWHHAIETLRTALQYEPEFAEAYYNLAGAYESAGDLTQAEQMYAKAVALNPGDPDAAAHLARLLYAHGAIDAAAKFLQAALTIDSSNSIARAVLLKMKADGVAQ